MSVLFVVCPKCTLAASHAVPYAYDVGTDRRRDHYITLSFRRGQHNQTHCSLRPILFWLINGRKYWFAPILQLSVQERFAVETYSQSWLGKARTVTDSCCRKTKHAASSNILVSSGDCRRISPSQSTDNDKRVSGKLTAALATNQIPASFTTRRDATPCVRSRRLRPS